jgi:hypothetical protein
MEAEMDRNDRAIDRPTGAGNPWLPPAAVVTGSLIGCVLPVIAYAQAMAILLGYGFVPRRWALLLIAVPTVVWLWPGGRLNPGIVTPLEWLVDTALFLGAQFVLAVIISTVVRRLLVRRK